MRPKFFVFMISIAFLVGCSSVTIRPDGGPKTNRNPDYEESKDYFWWGLSGEHTIKVDKVCNSKKPIQMQSQFTFLDGLFSFLTFGIYMPKTAKVWCKDLGASNE